MTEQQSFKLHITNVKELWSNIKYKVHTLTGKMAEHFSFREKSGNSTEKNTGKLEEFYTFFLWFVFKNRTKILENEILEKSGKFVSQTMGEPWSVIFSYWWDNKKFYTWNLNTQYIYVYVYMFFHSSNVVEKCVSFSSRAERAMFIDEVCSLNDGCVFCHTLCIVCRELVLSRLKQRQFTSNSSWRKTWIWCWRFLIYLNVR